MRETQPREYDDVSLIAFIVLVFVVPLIWWMIVGGLVARSPQVRPRIAAIVCLMLHALGAIAFILMEVRAVNSIDLRSVAATFPGFFAIYLAGQLSM